MYIHDIMMLTISLHVIYIRMTMHTGDQGPFEHEILAIYKRTSGVAFHEGAFNYAKALCCLRWISVIKVKNACRYIKCMHTYLRTYMHSVIHYTYLCIYMYLAYANIYQILHAGRMNLVNVPVI